MCTMVGAFFWRRFYIMGDVKRLSLFVCVSFCTDNMRSRSRDRIQVKNGKRQFELRRPGLNKTQYERLSRVDIKHATIAAHDNQRIQHRTHSLVIWLLFEANWTQLPYLSHQKCHTNCWSSVIRPSRLKQWSSRRYLCRCEIFCTETQMNGNSR